jgi:hypothetical protein
MRKAPSKNQWIFPEKSPQVINHSPSRNIFKIIEISIEFFHVLCQ